jgi:hypothetical protein
LWVDGDVDALKCFGDLDGRTSVALAARLEGRQPILDLKRAPGPTFVGVIPLLLVQAAWLVFAAAQEVAAVAMRARVQIALTFAAAGVLLAGGALSDEVALLIVGSVVALAAPLWVSLDRREFHPSHHLVRAVLLVFLVVITSWATTS